ncbi:MAG: right-handed parallel beta-helix repeat-containing protein [bacterium]
MPRPRGRFALLLLVATASRAAQIQVPAGGSFQAGLAAASPGDTVCVQAGTYLEQVTLVPGVALLGGWDAGFTSRDPDANVSMIHGAGVRSCIVSGSGADTATVVDGFTLRGAGGSPGAAIRVTGGSPVFSHNDVSENRLAGIAGGAYVSGGSTARFSDNEFRENSTGGSGGAFRIEGSSPVIERNVLTGNVARNSGGGFYVFQSTLACTDNTIRGGLAGNGGGGAFSFQECPAGGVVTGTVIEDCAAGHGGAIHLRDESAVTFVNTVIKRCSATAASGGFGGGVFVLGFSSIDMSSARFEDCSATADGGGVWSFQSTLKLTGPDATSASSPAAFSGCSALGRGGGIWAFATDDTTQNQIKGVRFSDCSARDEGGGFYFEECDFLFAKNLLERCSASQGGGGAVRTALSVGPPITVVVNNTFYACSSTLDPSTNPGAGLAVLGPNSPNAPTFLAGNIIAGTLSGACIGCPGGTQPRIDCSTFHNDAANPSNVSGGCPFQDGTNGNAARDPGFCDPNPVDYSLKDCALELNCPEAEDITGSTLRGVTDVTCPCAISAIEESSWGLIKSRYRR